MIRATAGTWANYATTLVFQVLFAAAFGTTTDASTFVIAFAVAVSASGVFTTTALSTVLPRMLTAEGAISRRAVKAIAALGVGAVATAGTILIVAAVAPIPWIEALTPGGAAESRAFLQLAAVMSLLLAVAGMLGAVALARGHRFLPTIAPALPSTAGVVYLVAAAEPSAIAALFAMTVGGVAQAGLSGALAALPRPVIAETRHLGTRSLAVWMFIVLIGLNALAPLQRMIASATDTAGAAQYDYAFRGLQVLLQLVIGGMAMAQLADWSRLRGPRHELRRRVSRGVALAALTLVVVGCLVSVSARPLVGTILERGAFGAADTTVVATLLVILAPGFVAEGLAVILSQGILAARFTKAFLRVNGVRFIGHLLLLIALGGPLGATGVAVAYVVTIAGTALATAAIATRIGMFRGHAGVLKRTAGASGLVIAATIGLSLLGDPWVALAIAGVLAATVISMVAFRLGELLPPPIQRRLQPTGGNA